MKGFMRRTYSAILFLTILSGAVSAPAYSQDKEGRWAVGFQIGGNLWLNSYNKQTVGPGGGISLRYCFSDLFSAGFVTGLEGLKSREDPAFPGTSPDYLKLNAIPLSLVGWVSLGPGKTINPYYYFGLGVFLYQRETTQNGQTLFLQDKKYHSSLHLPAGIGVEALLSRSLLCTVDLGYGLLDSHVDLPNAGRVTWYAAARLGVTFLFGTSAVEEKQRKRIAAEAEVRWAKQTAEDNRTKVLAHAEDQLPRDPAPSPTVAADDPPDPPVMPHPSARRDAGESTLLLERGKSLILKGVNFELNRAALTTDSEPVLSAVLSALLASPDIEVLIVGHTDRAGSRDFNQSLSFHRAQAVFTWLVKRGVSAKRLMVAGKGADEPIADNLTMQGRATNRRIELRVLK
jgi:outer membrane protein OmpA-like peptidoglycan-associated protein/opacity protein-like surface antigen